MNVNVLKYHMTRNYIQHAMYRAPFLASLPVCQIDEPRLRELADIEEKLPMARQIVDRLRFLSRVDRSKYTPHQGMREKLRRTGGTKGG